VTTRHPVLEPVEPRARAAAASAAPAPDRTRLEEHLATLLSPHSFESDQYRVLRHFLEQARLENGQTVLAITSPASGDGKTTTAINLAATLAQSPGTRVLLADTDLRRPFVAANLGVDEPGPGLVGAILDAQLDLGAVVRPTPFHLDVLPAGTPPANAYQVLESRRVGQLIEAARAAYDYVVLDTPPVVLVPDCRLMSQWVDGFLVVVAAHRTPRKLLGEALSALDPAKVLGIVFNGDDRRYGGYYRQGSGRKSRWEWPWKRHAPGPGRPAPWR
jgi:capsular exopolysaccharide synthesis family protein